MGDRKEPSGDRFQIDIRRLSVMLELIRHIMVFCSVCPWESLGSLERELNSGKVSEK